MKSKIMIAPSLSVVMANYNHAEYIGEALDAILSQSLRPCEMIVVDDASTDNSVDVIEHFARQDRAVHLLLNERNMGVVSTANRGLEYASGEYVYFASADDKVLPGFFEKSLGLLVEYPQAGLCCSNPAFFKDTADNVITVKRLNTSDGPTYFSQDESVGLIRTKRLSLWGHTSIIRRDALLEAGTLKAELRWHCDWFALYVIAFRYGVCYIPESLAALRIHPNSYSNSGMARWLEQKKVLEHILDLLKSPAFEDVLPSFRHSGVLSAFGFKMLRTILAKRGCSDLLTPVLTRQILRNEIYGGVARATPKSVKKIYRKLREKRQRLK